MEERRVEGGEDFTSAPSREGDPILMRIWIRFMMAAPSPEKDLWGNCILTTTNNSESAKATQAPAAQTHERKRQHKRTSVKGGVGIGSKGCRGEAVCKAKIAALCGAFGPNPSDVGEARSMTTMLEEKPSSRTAGQGKHQYLENGLPAPSLPPLLCDNPFIHRRVGDSTLSVCASAL
jgi:hypothetical protein